MASTQVQQLAHAGQVWQPDRQYTETADGVGLKTIGDEVDMLPSLKVPTMGASCPPLDSNGSKTSVLPARWRPPLLDVGYVDGVDSPGRAEHAIVAALRAPLAVTGRAARIGVCAVGGSGKTTACLGVTTCDWVRARFSKRTSWVQLDTSSTLQTVAGAVVSLVQLFCGDTAAEQLAAVTEDRDFVVVAASYVRSVPEADAAKLLIVIDDVLYKKRELLRQLLALIPPATPVIFSTRSEAVVWSVPGATLVSIDALPVEDARLVLAVAAGKTVVPGVSPFSAVEEMRWVRRVLDKTKCHALSLVLVGSMIADRGGAWRAVVAGLEQRWMDPQFGCVDRDSTRSSVRAALDLSFELLPNGVCRDAFAAVGVLPVHVPLPVLSRLWQFHLGGSASAGELTAEQSSAVMETSRVEELVATLMRAGLLRRDVDETSGELVGVIVHPVVGRYALSLLGDTARVIHQGMIDDYMHGVAVDDMDAHAWRRLPFWDVLDNGYWYDHAVRHVVAAGDVCGLVSVMDPAWQAARERVSSPLAFQADVEMVLVALMAVASDAAHNVVQSPVLLGRVHAALALAYEARIAVCRRSNMEAAIVQWQRALSFVVRADEPALWAEWQAGLGHAHHGRIGGALAANMEAAIACYQKALEVRTREAAPLEWAETQRNLGISYVDRVIGDKAANVEEAIACYGRALSVWTQAAAPLLWADAQNSLGGAYFYRIDGDKAANVEAAIACFSRALGEYTRSATPLRWARTRYNAGIAYHERLVGDRAAAIEAAIACYEDALTVRSREAAPLKWGATQNHLGNALRDRMFGDPAANQAAAIACFERALSVRTREAVPLNWATTQHNLGITHYGRHGGGATRPADVDAATACFRRALEVRTPEATPQEWALTTFSLMQALADGKRWSAAVECGRALERFGPRWAQWTAHQAVVVGVVAEAERTLASPDDDQDVE